MCPESWDYCNKWYLLTITTQIFQLAVQVCTCMYMYADIDVHVDCLVNTVMNSVRIMYIETIICCTMYIYVHVHVHVDNTRQMQRYAYIII